MTGLDINELQHRVEARHELLRRWLADGDRAAMTRFVNAQDPDYSMVTVEGELLDHAAFVRALEQAGGTIAGLVITIRDLRQVTDEVVTFTEEHRVGGLSSLRVVTAVLREGRWLWAQETTTGQPAKRWPGVVRGGRG